MREIEAREKQEEEEHGVTKLERAMNFLTPLDSINMGDSNHILMSNWRRVMTDE